ncbi:peroxidase [Acanthamoeba castellanii str. Neff]|uniref:Peroxidase n=1 Tax=Acanthamoeba castellanii (strain ATCC 30010 / Neff) TaxID=1257118 RepID=L8H083_ACACF|nr:peroxidase [Acanthamoeba castellanii str. Neff]ELR18168.1 peroxidase [Acanthamoeba castellanii str. Neff]
MAQQNYLRLGDTAPDFEADSTQGRISFHKWKEGKWAILFSHPGDYTPVCTTELGMTAKLQPEFAKRNTLVIGLSVDNVDDHHGWVKDIETTQNCTVNYPIVADPDRTVAETYGMIHPNSPHTMAGKLTVRTVWIIDPNNKVRLNLTYPAATGRNFNEVMRVLDALQLTDNYKVATPVNWEQGQDCVVLPTISTEDAKSLFPKGVTEVTPYLRLTPQPNLP